MEIYLQNENIWLTQQKMADLFRMDRSVVTKHLKNIFDTQELIQDSVCAKIAHTAADGKIYATQSYNLDAILRDAGKITHAVAVVLAEKEFEKFNTLQDTMYESDFDKMLKNLKSLKNK